MAKMKITVLRRMANPDLAAQYCPQGTIDIPCAVFADGQEFVVDESLHCPENFCSGAWHNVYQNAQCLMLGGNYPTWMKDEKVMILCCIDGIRPVVFKLERIKD